MMETASRRMSRHDVQWIGALVVLLSVTIGTAAQAAPSGQPPATLSIPHLDVAPSTSDMWERKLTGAAVVRDCWQN